jgi:hypothetical protein
VLEVLVDSLHQFSQLGKPLQLQRRDIASAPAQTSLLRAKRAFDFCDLRLPRFVILKHG